MVSIGIDFSGLDRLTIGNGLYRYVVDLVRGLSELSQANVKFVLFGSKPKPVAELTDIFETQGDRWSYEQIKPWEFKGSYYLNQLRYLWLIKSRQIDLWHVLNSFIPMAAPCRIVMTEYDLMYELFDEYREATRSRPYKIKKWSARHRVNHIIAISQTTADDIERKWQVSSGKISVVHLGTNLLDVDALSADGDAVQLIHGHSEPTILSPFNLEPRKNMRSLLLAMPILLEKHSNLRLVLFGQAAWTPEREQEFRNLVRELHIEDSVICTGFVQDVDLAALYRYATIFVFPSLYEGFGLPVLEAMSVGACVVARKASSMAEVVGDAGVLVERCDQDDLASAILTLLDSELMRKQLGEAARQRAKEFSIQNMALKTWQVYEQVLNPIQSKKQN
jgi:glycosyltransferase involved in cell wall biosynthesis